jgi:hypothetical protein
MKRLIVAAITAAATVILTVGCGSPSGTSMGAGPMYGSAENDRLCQTLQGYRSRGLTPELQEQCVRQLGQDTCRRCLSAP